MTPTFSTALIITVLVFAFLGALANATLAWLNQKPRPPFDPGSFVASAITALVTAIGIAEVFNYAGVTNTALACLAAFIPGWELTVLSEAYSALWSKVRQLLLSRNNTHLGPVSSWVRSIVEFERNL